jgi:hypothetical protein
MINAQLEFRLICKKITYGCAADAPACCSEDCDGCGYACCSGAQLVNSHRSCRGQLSAHQKLDLLTDRVIIGLNLVPVVSNIPEVSGLRIRLSHDRACRSCAT